MLDLKMSLSINLSGNLITKNNDKQSFGDFPVVDNLLIALSYLKACGYIKKYGPIYCTYSTPKVCHNRYAS